MRRGGRRIVKPKPCSKTIIFKTFTKEVDNPKYI